MLSILWYVLGPALSPPYALLQKNNQSPSNRVATETLIPTPFPPSKLCCAPGLFPLCAIRVSCASYSVCGEASKRPVLWKAASGGAAVAAKNLDYGEPQNIIIQDHGQGQEKENESQIMKEENTGAGAEAKRTNFFLKQARRHESKDKSSKKHKSEEHNDKEHSSDKGRERLNSSENGVIVVEAESGRSQDPGVGIGRSQDPEAERGRNHDPEAGKENVGSDLVPAQDQDIGIEVEAGVGQGVEVGRNTAMDAQEALARRLERAKKLQEQREKEMVEKQKQQEIAAAAATGGSVLNVAALLASGTQVTPQIAMAAQMAALQAKALAETGIAVPSYYNPAAVNPMKFAEQEKKRKMLWQGKKEGDKSQSAEIWEKLNFGNKDQNVKFRKLMGIKSEDEAGCSSVDEESYKTLKQQEEVFRNLDAQYEMARSQTHTQRGMGLGFTSSMRGMDAV
ncbi:hypothetical protein Celaphus_00000362 [Cervus elaphus hippelaphus]|uniref:Arginine/serine-rich coiled-coil protein 2 n=1 Tax=Cervus elaphus hippelaphus TaxID=46360 RepID=A0A212D6I2_CEREH|nr:hypothetical protein Celaphus_00000362 [Cervus elaphus hippelaphus]